MSTNANPPKNGGRETYSVKLHAKVQSSTTCSFCWFVLTVYPTLNGMTERDRVTYKAHLEQVHGLKTEISA